MLSAFFLKKLSKIAGLTFLLAFLIAGGFAVHTQVQAASSDRLTGWAWSSNVGWISFNNCSSYGAGCVSPDYGVTVSTTDGKLKGYAWSPNVGWLKFDNTLSTCPNGSGGTTNTNCTPQIVFANSLPTTQVRGFAQFCAGTINGDCTGGDRTDGWDGWVSLSPSGFGGVSYSTSSGSRLTGFAWGNEVVGWTEFNPPNGGVNVEFTSCTSPNGAVGQQITSYPSATALNCAATQFTSTCLPNGTWSPSVGSLSCTDTPAPSNPCQVPNSKGTSLGSVVANGSVASGTPVTFYINKEVENDATGNITCTSNGNSLVRVCNGAGNLDANDWTPAFSSWLPSAGEAQYPVCRVLPYTKER